VLAAISRTDQGPRGGARSTWWWVGRRALR